MSSSLSMQLSSIIQTLGRISFLVIGVGFGELERIQQAVSHDNKASPLSGHMGTPLSLDGHMLYRLSMYVVCIQASLTVFSSSFFHGYTKHISMLQPA